MRNVVPRVALARRSRNLLLGSVLIFLLGAVAIVIAFFMHTVPLVVPANPNYGLYVAARSGVMVLGVALLLLAAIAAIRALTWKQDNALAEAIGDALLDFLDERYVYIRNVSRSALGYIDAVLVGPPGVLVFRITQRSGVFYNEGARWMKQRDKGSWRTLRWSPTKEVVVDVEKVRQFLEARSLPDVPVFGVIVFTEEEPATLVTTDQPVVPVLQPHELSYGLEDTYFSKKDRIDQLTANKTATLLYG
ncbi:MAG: NERD domain-containing protein [Anaerolineae bacterium]|nr:NERD domain-containing protein [Anaerolineae bacterium]